MRMKKHSRIIVISGADGFQGHVRLRAANITAKQGMHGLAKAIAREFGAVIGLSTAVSQFTFALAPALLGVIRDATGGYPAVLAACLSLQLAAAIVVLARR